MNISFKLLENETEMEKVINLRHKVFVEEDGYPPEAIKNTYDNKAIHFIATKGKEVIGCVSVILSGSKSLPFEDFIDLSPYKGEKIAEVQKLAIIPEERKGIAAVGLMLLSYEFIKKNGYNKICIFSLEKKTDNIRLYKRLGFKIIDKFKFYNVGNALAMILDMNKDSVYEKEKDKRKLKEYFIAKKLSDAINSIINLKINE